MYNEICLNIPSNAVYHIEGKSVKSVCEDEKLVFNSEKPYIVKVAFDNKQLEFYSPNHPDKKMCECGGGLYKDGDVYVCDECFHEYIECDCGNIEDIEYVESYLLGNVRKYVCLNCQKSYIDKDEEFVW